MIIRATNKESLTKLLELDDLWDDMLEEGNQKVISSDSNTWYLPILKTKDEIAGVAIAQWLGNNLITWHFGLLKKYRGPDSYKYGLEAKQFIDDIRPGIKHITLVPEYKKDAIRFAQKVGFKETHRIKQSILKDGKHYSRIIYED